MTDTERTEVVRSLVRRWRTSVLIVVFAALGGLAYGLLAPRTYTAEAFLVAVPQVPGDTTSATAFSTAYTRLATQPSVLASAAAASGIPADTLRSAVSAATSPDAPVISISGVSHDPADAAADANAVAQALSDLATAHLTDTSVRLTMLAAAQAPTQSSSPSPTLDTGLGVAAGVLLASLAALAGGGTTGRRREREPEAPPNAPASAPEAEPEPEGKTPAAPQEPASAPPEPESENADSTAQAETQTNHLAPVSERSSS